MNLLYSQGQERGIWAEPEYYQHWKTPGDISKLGSKSGVWGDHGYMGCIFVFVSYQKGSADDN